MMMGRQPGCSLGPKSGQLPRRAAAAGVDWTGRAAGMGSQMWATESTVSAPYLVSHIGDTSILLRPFARGALKRSCWPLA